MSRISEQADARIVDLQARRTARLLARAAKDPLLAALLESVHRRLGLWRLCGKRACKRAHACRGDPLLCGARRWPAGRSCLYEAARAHAGHRPRRALHRHLRQWSDQDGIVARKPGRSTLGRIIVRWARPGEGKHQRAASPSAPRGGCLTS